MKLWRKLKSSGSSAGQPRSTSDGLQATVGRQTPQGRRGENRRDVEIEPASSAVKDQAAQASDDEVDQEWGQFGMFILSDKAENEAGVVDIIAIHGLNGHYLNTWTTSKAGVECNWLKNLLPKQIPNARIMSFGYNSSVQFSKSTAGIGSFAEELLEAIMSWRGTVIEKARPIIFICHSLGGIVFKKVVNPNQNTCTQASLTA